MYMYGNGESRETKDRRPFYHCRHGPLLACLADIFQMQFTLYFGTQSEVVVLLPFVGKSP